MLAEKDDWILLLSKYALVLPRQNAHTAITWDQSDLRAWLNGEFLQTAFSGEEQAAILLSDLDNGDEDENALQGRFGMRNMRFMEGKIVM